MAIGFKRKRRQGIHGLSCDFTEPKDDFEDEGYIVDTFWRASKHFGKCNYYDWPKSSTFRRQLAHDWSVIHIATHGGFIKVGKGKRKRGLFGKSEGKEIEILDGKNKFQCDVLVVTACNGFNNEILQYLEELGPPSTYISASRMIYPEEAILFSMAFYLYLLRDLRRGKHFLSMTEIDKAFNKAHKVVPAFRKKHFR
jgi:hypothetical protein